MNLANFSSAAFHLPKSAATPCEEAAAAGDFQALEDLAREELRRTGKGCGYAYLAWSLFARGRAGEGSVAMAQALLRVGVDVVTLHVPVAYLSACGATELAAVAWYGPRHWKRKLHALDSYPMPAPARVPAEALERYAELFIELTAPAWKLDDMDFSDLEGIAGMFENRFGALPALRAKKAEVDAACAARQEILDALVDDAPSAAPNELVRKAGLVAPSLGDDERAEALGTVGSTLARRGEKQAAAAVLELAMRAGADFVPPQVATELAALRLELGRP